MIFTTENSRTAAAAAVECLSMRNSRTGAAVVECISQPRIEKQLLSPFH